MLDYLKFRDMWAFISSHLVHEVFNDKNTGVKVLHRLQFALYQDRHLVIIYCQGGRVKPQSEGVVERMDDSREDIL